MLDDSQRLQLALIPEQELPQQKAEDILLQALEKVADLPKHETNGMSGGAAALITASRVGDRA